MSTYLVTGATGFIGSRLVPRLLARGGTVHVLVRPSSMARLEACRARWPGGERVVAVVGDLHEDRLGVDDDVVADLRGSVDHLVHLAALYDLRAPAHRLEAANVVGTRHAVDLAEALAVGCFHHVSSIAAAGRYRGTFTEDMFDEATGLDEPYFRTKHAAEGIVRDGCAVPWRIYRPGIVVGDSTTGEMDRVDGPYLAFPLLQRLAAALPGRVPIPVADTGARLHLVPVDHVVAALDHLVHHEGLDGQALHLLGGDAPTVVEALDLFSRAARGPRFVPVGGPVGATARRVLEAPGAGAPLGALGTGLGAVADLPPGLVRLLDWPTRFDDRRARAALAGSGLQAPPLADYADRLWAWWEDELDVDLGHTHALERAVAGRRVLITGASAGIGRAAAHKLGAAGARVLLVARSAERLEHVRATVAAAGGEAHVLAADLADPQACDALVERVIADHGGVDVLVNNAGHSIRRSLRAEEERLHDYERLMQLNYFGALRLTMGLLPGMRERGDGHVVNVSSMGVQTGGPRFSAYVASKAAFDAFARSAAAELLGDGVAVTTVYMPLVRTAMSRPTRLYDLLPEMTSAQAADWICRAVVDRPRRLALPGATLAEAAYLVSPELTDALESGLYRASRHEPGPGAALRATAGVAADLTRRWSDRLRRRLPVGPPPGPRR